MLYLPLSNRRHIGNVGTVSTTQNGNTGNAGEVSGKTSKSTTTGATKIIHKDGQVEIIGEGDIVNIIDNRPYLNPKSRPSHRTGVAEQVFEDARGVDGFVRDPLTDEIIHWEPGQPRKGVWDMGHIPEEQYAVVHKRYLEGKMTPAEFRDWYNNPKNYRPELPSTNRSHQLEIKEP